MSKSKVSAFIIKLSKILNDENNKESICWSTNSTFTILDKNKLCNEVLPSSFKSHSYNSFIRQLNKYDFKKIRGTNSFKHHYFKRNDTSCFNQIIPKGSYGTFREIRKNKLSISLFNYTVINSMKKITSILEEIEKNFYLQASNPSRILIFENFEFKNIANQLKSKGFKVSQVYFYSEFERKICKEFFNFLIIDQNFYEIFKRDCYDNENIKKLNIILTWEKEKIGMQTNVYKTIEKPYTADDLIPLFNILK